MLQNIDHEFAAGKIHGVFGINGSGKTMLLRLIAGLLIPDTGKVVVNGVELGKDVDFAPQTGIIIENTDFFNQLTGLENLAYLAKIQQVAQREDMVSALTTVGLTLAQQSMQVKEYSLGMRQKLAIAQAIFEHPQVLLLDEPTNALDDVSVRRLQEYLINFAHAGGTVIIVSHAKQDILPICDEVLTMTAGKLQIVCD